MKLAILALITSLGISGSALADGGPPGLTQTQVVDYQPGPGRAPRTALRQAILERFDRNHDGRLEPRERRQAVKALRKLARKLARDERRAERGQRRADRLIQRYDLNGDGNVGPGEIPPNVARKLRRLDRNGDGWVDGNELAPRR
jgi:Ca2+-binding EF-hand superfamily protein